MQDVETSAFACTTIPSPVGPLKLVASEAGLAAILWEHDRPVRVRLGKMAEHPQHRILRRTETQLAEYFAGRRTAFAIELDLVGTAFQKSVWAALLEIPFGATCTYRQIAGLIARASASRAVGAAIGRNPVSIIVPCHRVVGSNGALTGFAGGLDTKRHLLALEGRRSLLAA